ncbi:hypothetical protein A9Q96_09920 [Rhodobacterales bacterium 52_120_T64]|nr:hypothetical protein A9Q96_09920 [Rhodobacterales bacterium 52_120_T64]
MYRSTTGGYAKMSEVENLIDQDGYSLEYVAAKNAKGEDGWGMIVVSPDGEKYDVVNDTVNSRKIYINAERMYQFIGRMTPDIENITLPMLDKYKVKKSSRKK